MVHNGAHAKKLNVSVTLPGKLLPSITYDSESAPLHAHTRQLVKL